MPLPKSTLSEAAEDGLHYRILQAAWLMENAKVKSYFHCLQLCIELCMHAHVVSTSALCFCQPPAASAQFDTLSPPLTKVTKLMSVTPVAP